MPRIPQKTFKPEVGNCCYADIDKRFAIGYDKWQWILQRGRTHYYYGTLESLLSSLLRYELMDITSFDTKTVLDKLQKVEDYITKISKEINLPKGGK